MQIQPKFRVVLNVLASLIVSGPVLSATPCQDAKRDEVVVTVSALMVAAENWRQQAQFFIEYEYEQRTAATLEDGLQGRYLHDDPNRERKHAYASGWIIKSIDGYRHFFSIVGPSDFDVETGNSSWSSIESGYFKDVQYLLSPHEPSHVSPGSVGGGSASFFPRRSSIEYGKGTTGVDPIAATNLSQFAALASLRDGKGLDSTATLSVEPMADGKLCLTIIEGESDDTRTSKFTFDMALDIPLLCEAWLEHVVDGVVISQSITRISDFSPLKDGMFVPQRIVRVMGPVNTLGTDKATYVARQWRATKTSFDLPDNPYVVAIPAGVVFQWAPGLPDSIGPATVDLSQGLNLVKESEPKSVLDKK